MAPLLEARGIVKEFGPVRVLNEVPFSLEAGEVHALIGENGAGKSTLMRILCGLERPTRGELFLRGSPVHYHSVGEGERRGVVMIHQEFNLADELSVEENIFLGREITRGPLLQQKAMREETRRLLAELECEVEPEAPVRTLSVSQKQMVEIAKALSRNAQVLIMDEPTAALTSRDVERLFRLIRKLTASGVGIVYISHKLDEVKAIADRVTVLRDGEWVTTQPAPWLTLDEMAVLMVGRPLTDLFPPKRPPSHSDVVLEVERVTVPGFAYDCSFTLRRGEILGFAGLVGAGRTELLEGVFGLRRRSGGTIRRNGRPLRLQTFADAVREGMVYLTEDRKGKGLITSMPLAPNLTLLSLKAYCRPFIDRRLEEKALESAAATFEIRAPHLRAPAGHLSGGNQQKLALAKMMEVNPQIVALDEPTRGIDVGTKRELYRFIAALASEGRSCILVSSELSEIVGLCHRVAVMRGGTIAKVLEGDAVNQEEIMRYATGVRKADE